MIKKFDTFLNESISSRNLRKTFSRADAIIKEFYDLYDTEKKWMIDDILEKKSDHWILYKVDLNRIANPLFVSNFNPILLSATNHFIMTIYFIYILSHIKDQLPKDVYDEVKKFFNGLKKAVRPISRELLNTSKWDKRNPILIWMRFPNSAIKKQLTEYLNDIDYNFQETRNFNYYNNEITYISANKNIEVDPLGEEDWDD